MAEIAKQRILADSQPVGTAKTNQVFAPIREQFASLVFILENSNAVHFVTDVVTHQPEKLAILGFLVRCLIG
jgi:hypothetical protein